MERKLSLPEFTVYHTSNTFAPGSTQLVSGPSSVASELSPLMGVVQSAETVIASAFAQSSLAGALPRDPSACCACAITLFVPVGSQRLLPLCAEAASARSRKVVMRSKVCFMIVGL